MRRASRAQRGFTMIEMLVVVIILAISAAIVTAMMGSNGATKVASAARQMSSDMAFAQNRAIARQATEYVVFNVSAQTYTIEEGSPMSAVTNPLTLASYAVQMGTGTSDNSSITSASFDNKLILAYDEAGVPFSYDTNSSTKTLMIAGTIVLNCEGFTNTLTVQPHTGEVTVSTP